MTEPERKYTAAENATATIVGTIAPGGTSPPTSRYVVAAAKVAMLSWPKLNRTLRAGLGVGVTAFTPTTTRFAHRATPVPKSTYAAIFTANATEIALERKSITGLRWATPASVSRNTNITGSSDAAGRTESELRTKHSVPPATTAAM